MAEHDREYLGVKNDAEDLRTGVWDDDQEHGPTPGDLQPTQGEIASGVDASTTAENVRGQAFNRGFAVNMVRTQPDPIGTGASGGGVVSFGNSGATVTAGGTAGDTATLYGPNLVYFDNLNRFYYRFSFHTKGAAPNDHIGVGHTKNGNSGGWYLDLTNSDIVTGGTVRANLDWDPSSTVIEAWWHKGSNLYITSHVPGNSYSYQVTPPSNPNPGEFVYAESNGNGDDIQVSDAAFFSWNATEGGTEQ